MKYLVGDNYCFACGPQNPVGLHLKIVEETSIIDGDKKSNVYSIFSLPSKYQGYKNKIHGGIITTILDEMLVWVCYLYGYEVITAEINVRFKKSLIPDKEYKVTGRVVKEKGSLMEAETWIEDKKRNMIAIAKGKMWKVKDLKK